VGGWGGGGTGAVSDQILVREEASVVLSRQ
jgi:hypothetical protein